MRNKIIAFGAILISMSSCQSNQMTHIQDNFESDSLSKIWTNDKFIPGALTFQSKYFKTGNKAAMLTIRQGNQIDEEKGTILERAELKESKKLVSKENLNYYYSFSIFLPNDFPIVPTRLVIAQWKQDCKSENCDPDNPVIALRYSSGEFFITLQTGPNKEVLYSQKESILNHWLDFKFQIRFSRNINGVINARLNEKQIIDYKGVTAYSQEFGYTSQGDFYFKIGLYRDTMAQPMTIYIDNYTKQLLPKL